MKYSEAIRKLEADHPAWRSSEPLIDEPDVVWGSNVVIAREVGGALAEGFGDRVEFGTFDNCREYGLTFTAGDWTFCCFEHRNCDDIMVEGCPTVDVKKYGPYGCENKWAMMWGVEYGQYETVARALSAVLQVAMAGSLTRGEAIAVLTSES